MQCCTCLADLEGVKAGATGSGAKKCREASTDFPQKRALCKRLLKLWHDYRTSGQGHWVGWNIRRKGSQAVYMYTAGPLTCVPANYEVRWNTLHIHLISGNLLYWFLEISNMPCQTGPLRHETPEKKILVRLHLGETFISTFKWWIPHLNSTNTFIFLSLLKSFISACLRYFELIVMLTAFALFSSYKKYTMWCLRLPCKREFS